MSPDSSMAPPTQTELTSSAVATSIDSLPVELLTEVMLRVPTPAALVHAAAASTSLCRVIAGLDFLARYRKRHRSSPLLGLYIPRQDAGPPSFQMPDSIRSAAAGVHDRDLKDAVLKAFAFDEVRRHQDHRLQDGAFSVGRLEVHPACRLLDCHNSRLLLTRGDEALEVRSPLARESILVPFPRDVVRPDCFQACLLQGRHDDGAASFRVVHLQHRREGRNRQARAVEYDSGRKSWQHHSWETLNNTEGTPGEVMHAGHRIFCKNTGTTSETLLLDTRKMEFSVLSLPSDNNPRNYAIGEMEDNVCCLASVQLVGGSIWHNSHLRVWKLDNEKLDWKLEKEMQMDQMLREHAHHGGYYRVRAVTNGIALLCSTTKHRHFIVDLNTFNVKDKFEFNGQVAYLMQMPWPPVFSGATVNAMNPGSCEEKNPGSSDYGNNENQHELRDGAAPLICMASNDPQYLGIQYPIATPAAEQFLGKDKNYVPNDYDIESLIPDLFDQFSDLMHPEGSLTRFYHPERRKSLIRLDQGDRSPFVVSNQLHPKYCIKDAEIAPSCPREASAASTAAVSGECTLFLGASTFKLTGEKKQRIIDQLHASGSDRGCSDGYLTFGASARQRYQQSGHRNQQPEKSAWQASLPVARTKQPRNDPPTTSKLQIFKMARGQEKDEQGTSNRAATSSNVSRPTRISSRPKKPNQRYTGCEWVNN